MDNLINSIQNKALQGLASLAPRGVVDAIQGAARESGVDFAYLMQQAKAESSFQPDAKAKTSSASGLFQFIESTWMNMVDRYGAQHGIDTAAPKEELLELRNDPQIASKMAAEFAGENQRVLDRNWGGDVGSTELYFAHFMGAGGASAFLKARDADGAAPAAVLFPKAAKANQNVFYDAGGRSKSLDEVYAFFDNKFQIEGTTEEAPAQMAETSSPAPVAPVASTTFTPSPVKNSSTFSVARPSYASNYSAASYQSLLHNPIDLMLLTQLELPIGDKQSNDDVWGGRSIF